MTDPALARLEALLEEHGDDLPLDEGAIAIAQLFDPACQREHVLDDLDTLARATRFEPGVAPGRAMGRINEVLFRRFEFRGDTEQYHHPYNSFIHQVLGRRLGMPITLCLVYAEIARRLDVHLDGVGFPGHFVLRPRHAPNPVFIDAFHSGRVLQEDQLWGFFTKQYPDAAISEATWQGMMEPVSRRAFLTRIARNLRASYAMQESAEGVAKACSLLVLLEDEPEHHRDLGMSLLASGDKDGARDALATYLALRPDADDAMAVAARLTLLGTA